jgi:transcriptional regulator with XRE-family HTH domain
MITDSSSTSASDDNPLGIYLRDRRARLDAAALGLSPSRRRTPGLRREEVAQRANVSTTWYTWLEQGRGGAPSPAVLDRLARALALTAGDREHLYLLAQRRAPKAPYEAAERVNPRLQRVLDGLEFCPAFVKNDIWDIVAWNRAASTVLTDYGAIPVERRNGLRLLFTDPRMRDGYPDWEVNARFVVGVFKSDTIGTGASKRAERLVDDLCGVSPDFKAMWHDSDVRLDHEDRTKRINHPIVDAIALDYSAYAVDGQPSLTLMIFTPAAPIDADRVRSLLQGRLSPDQGRVALFVPGHR